MKKLRKLFSVMIVGCLVLASMSGMTVQAEGDTANAECIVADFGDSATVEGVADNANYLSKATNIKYGTSASSLKITGNGGDQYISYPKDVAMVPKEADVSGYKYFRMRIYSENKGDTFVVILREDNQANLGGNHCRYVVTTQGTGWQEIAIAPADCSINNGVKWNNIGGVWMRTGINSTVIAAGHEIYIDKIWFGNTAGEKIDSADRHVVADFSNSETSAAIAAKGTVIAENNVTIIPGETAVRWNFNAGNTIPAMANNGGVDVSEYDNVRMRFYSPHSGDQLVLFATYKEQNSVSNNPYFYYVITSNGNGWQDVKIPKKDFTAGTARPITDGGDNVEPTWSHIGAMYMERTGGGNYGVTNWPYSGNSIVLDSILFEKEEETETPELPAKDPVIIADFADTTTVDSIADNEAYLSKSTDRTYRKAASSLKITFPDYDFYLLGSDGKNAMASPVADVSEYKYFRMRLYSKHAGDSFNVIVRSGDTECSAGGNHFRYVVKTTGIGWQEVAVPLSAFETRGGATWSNVGGVYLRTGLLPASTTAGESMYIDKIWFADTDGSEDKIDHIMSDELYINESDKVINGFYGMTVAQVRENILLPDNVELIFSTADGEKITDETILAVKGMVATLSNDEYLLYAALYGFDAKFNGKTTKKFSAGSLKVDLTAKCYRQGITVGANVIVAQYSDDGRLIGIAIAPGTITSSGETTFTTTYEVEMVANTKIKVYVWGDFSSINPLMDETITLTPATV